VHSYLSFYPATPQAISNWSLEILVVLERQILVGRIFPTRIKLKWLSKNVKFHKWGNWELKMKIFHPPLIIQILPSILELLAKN